MLVAGNRNTCVIDPAPPGTAWVELGAAYRSSSLPSTARARAPGLCGRGRDRACGMSELSASLATSRVASSAGATSGACVGAESWPASRRRWARARSWYSTVPMTMEATSRMTKSTVWWRGIMEGQPPRARHQYESHCCAIGALRQPAPGPREPRILSRQGRLAGPGRR